MSDEEIRTVYQRIATIMRRDGDYDYYFACLVVADLGSEPFKRVWELCLDED